MKNNILKSSDGSILFAIVTAMVISFTVGSLTLLASNQCMIIEKEIIRKTTYYWLRAGMEYANYQLRNNLVAFNNGQATFDLPEKTDIHIKITQLPSGGLSDYQVEVSGEI